MSTEFIRSVHKVFKKEFSEIDPNYFNRYDNIEDIPFLDWDFSVVDMKQDYSKLNLLPGDRMILVLGELGPDLFFNISKETPLIIYGYDVVDPGLRIFNESHNIYDFGLFNKLVYSFIELGHGGIRKSDGRCGEYRFGFWVPSSNPTLKKKLGPGAGLEKRINFYPNNSESFFSKEHRRVLEKQDPFSVAMALLHAGINHFGSDYVTEKYFNKSK